MPRYFADMVGSYRGHARKKKIPFELTLQQFYDITQQNCHYCGDSPRLRNLSGNDVHANGVDRLDSSCGYTLDNVVTCCTICNVAKSAMTVEEFKQWVLRVAMHWGFAA
jgi:hypothetical protein